MIDEEEERGIVVTVPEGCEQGLALDTQTQNTKHPTKTKQKQTKTKKNGDKGESSNFHFFPAARGYCPQDRQARESSLRLPRPALGGVPMWLGTITAALGAEHHQITEAEQNPKQNPKLNKPRRGAHLVLRINSVNSFVLSPMTPPAWRWRG